MDEREGDNLAGRIRKLRKEKKLSQDDLARKADIPYTTLTKIEIGVIKKPSVYAVAKIARALDIDINDLLDGLLM